MLSNPMGLCMSKLWKTKFQFWIYPFYISVASKWRMKTKTSIWILQETIQWPWLQNQMTQWKQIFKHWKKWLLLLCQCFLRMFFAVVEFSTKAWIWYFTLLGLCNEHPPNTRHDIKASHLSYFLYKLHFGEIKTDITIVPLHIFPKKSFNQEIWEPWHFDFRLTSWLMIL